MYRQTYQLTHDMDCFFELNGFPIHIATNGGIVPSRLGTVGELQTMQRQVTNMEAFHPFHLNTFYLSSLNVDDYPSREDLVGIDIVHVIDLLFNETNEYAALPFFKKVYSYSFVQMARKGFWSFDRIGQTLDGEDIYKLVAWPSDSIGESRLHVGHQFEIDSNRWLDGYYYRCSLMEIVSEAKLIC